MAAADRGFALLAASIAALFVASVVFAGLALLLRLRNDRVERSQQQLTDRWEPTLLEVLVGKAPDAALQTLVAPRDAPLFLSFLSGYARRLRGEESATVRRLAKPLLPALARSLPKGGAEKRGLAVHRLSEIGLPEYADQVAAALDDPSPNVSVIAARGLFREGMEPHFPAVLQELPRFAHLNRHFLSSMLARGGAGAAPLLREIFASPYRSGQVRAIVADSLTLLNDLDAVPVAIDHLRTAKDREVVAASLRLVRHLGHTEHVAFVRPLVASPDAIIRAAAAGALGALGGHEEVALLQDALDDDHYWVSLQAARGLMALGDIETLRRLAESTGAWAVLAQQVLSE
jgi:HEAT repeat protein